MTTIEYLIVIACLLPLVSSLVNIFFGKKVLRQNAGWFAAGVMLGSFVLSFAALLMWMGGEHTTPLTNLRIPWIPIGGGQWLQLGVMVDGLCVAMVTMVTFIATLVHVYSIGYMAGDKRFERFFAYLSLFTFSMLGIVTANSIMQLFVFWELVGLTSYLLISFWFEKRGPQLASKKAFVMNRVGDMGFLIGFGILFWKLGANVLLPPVEGGMFEQLASLLAAEGYSFTNPPGWLTAAGIGLFFGAIGKSAQFPLHTWLPDAMEGPTPVSSIVHSATMVAAGVYLTARLYPILTPAAHLFIATIGLITLVMAACMALVMTDIKKVLAYSTLSQLGYMILGLGAGAYSFALFHLITHAFFKCCLFQCSGSGIHAAHHQQDMRYYGGLKDKLPVTAACYFICTLAIAGASIPWTSFGLSGFYSKDGIIAGAVNYGEALSGIGWWANLFWLGPMVIAYVTPFYMARSFALTFLGKPRDQHLYDNAHEAPWTMTVPQVCLAALAVFAAVFPFLSLINETQGYMVGRMGEGVTAWVQPGVEAQMEYGYHLVHAGLLHGLVWILCIGAGVLMYKDGMTISSKIVRLPVVNQLYTWAHNKFYFDALYDAFFVNVAKAGAAFAAGFDKYFVDNLVNMTGATTIRSALGTGWIDRRFVDGLVNGMAQFAQNAGGLLRQVQVGRVRAYVMVMFAAAVVVTLLVVMIALVPDAAVATTP